jgi:hypothetical protein
LFSRQEATVIDNILGPSSGAIFTIESINYYPRVLGETAAL